VKSVLKRRVAKYSRWLHIYTSMASFVIVFFFAATGLTLNHVDWFSGAERTARVTGALDPSWTNTGTGEIRKLEIVEALRGRHGVGGAVREVRVDDAQIAVSFKGPGYSADAFIDRKAATYDLTETRMGAFAILNDLHKGRDTGPVWSAVIDVSAGLLTFISITGLILIFFIHKHRVAGLVLVGIGAAAAYLMYCAWVP
jgi:hypothetical protein